MAREERERSKFVIKLRQVIFFPFSPNQLKQVISSVGMIFNCLGLCLGKKPPSFCSCRLHRPFGASAALTLEDAHKSTVCIFADNTELRRSQHAAEQSHHQEGSQQTCLPGITDRV